MSNLNTFEGSGAQLNSLQAKQKEYIEKMRTNLLVCGTDSTSAVTAINNITVLRIYHQIDRIIKYLDLMDKLEEKMYKSIEYTIDKSSPESTATWFTLLGIQERMQKLMIESHKLLQPYLDIENLTLTELMPKPQQEAGTSSSPILLSAESREKLRTNAQHVLDGLKIEDAG